MIVCHCHAVRAEEIRTEVRLGAETVEVVGARCGAGTRCGGCIPALEAVIADEQARMRDAVPAPH
ncbi:MAG TPA: (2Fe-2S)-binding protein [Acidimicrobiales bacterium]|nr:(2Fe-2S)-binding protein [Acidimicrobiales bacterium]